MPKRPRETTSKTIDNDGESDQKRNFPKILDGKYFVVLEYDKETEYVRAKCTNCKKGEIRGKKSSTGNYHAHYTRVHADISEDVKNYCDEKAEKRVTARKLNKQTVLPFGNSLDPMKV